MADLEQVIQSRRSIRRYTGEPVAAEVIEQLLRTAMWAPSAHNRQPWRWVVVSSPETKARLARAMGERLRADRRADGDASELIEAALARSYARLTTAPVLIVACSTLAGIEAAPGSRVWRAEHAMAMQSVAAAIDSLLLAAEARGLGACWVCAPLFCPEAVRETLALPDDWEAQALVTLGQPAEAKAPSPRRPLAETVLYR
jgi:coenzyme F420-0:L-glutamate ligase / coenzyme F420-1:gamma-L-glutamate ligase